MFSTRPEITGNDLRDLVYFVSIIVAFLAANAVLIDLKKAD